MADIILDNTPEEARHNLAQAFVEQGDVTPEALTKYGVSQEHYEAVAMAFTLRAETEARKAGLENLAEWLDCLPTDDWAEARHMIVTGKWTDIRAHMRLVAKAIKEQETGA